MENVKLGHFSEYQKTFVIACVANDLEIKESIKCFQDVFPDFGTELDKKTLEHKLARRISDIKRKNVPEIEAYRELAKHSDLHQVACIPIAYTEVRQQELQNMYDALPDESLKSVQRDKSGKEYRVYESNAPSRLAILKSLRKEQNSGLSLEATLEHLKGTLQMQVGGLY